jgi:DNA-binding IclR family transcriptional regulator
MPSLKTPSVRTVDRALAILELLAGTAHGLAMADLARQMSLPKSSVHCLLLTLERGGYVHLKERTRRYVLGLKLFDLANMALGGLKMREQAAPFLRALAQRTCLTAHMAVLKNGEAVLVEKIEVPGSLRVASWIGKRMDVHCTALGKILAAALPEQELDELVLRRPLLQHNDNTITSLKKLREELGRVRRLGFAVDDEEDGIGSRCIGAPVLGADGCTTGAISVHGSIMEITDANLSQLAEHVRHTAADISAALKVEQSSPER